MNVLEIGCGNYRTKTANVAVDISKCKDIDILCDGHLLPFPNSTFSHVVMLEVLDTINLPYKALCEVNRVLEPNGTLIMSIHNIYYFRRILKWAITRKHVSVCQDTKYAWGISELMHLFDLTGFKLIDYNFIDYSRHNKPSKISSLMPHLTKHSFFIRAQKIVCLS
jgi:SAM-dependent methyltransferase